jgi:short-subunit dehydrogenase
MGRIASFRGMGCLVTGASSGIGREIARILAAQGARVVVSARRKERLDALAAELSGASGAEVVPVVADLAEDGAAEALATEAERRLGAVDVLVSNAGFSVPGPFVRSDVERTLRLVRVNMVAPVLLARRLLPGMVTRDRGGILTVSSVAGFQASPYQAAYAGSKAFLLVFSDCLHQEVKHTNVAITALCPGVTDTEFFDAAGFRTTTGFLQRRASAAKVARKGVRGLQRGRMDVVPGPLNKALVWVQRIVTRRFAASVSRRLMGGRGFP